MSGIKEEARKMRISPRARKTAERIGLCLEGLQIEDGTGFDGGICEQDILRVHKLSKNKKTGVTPLARNVAAAEGIDLSTVKGTGANGKILQADVKDAVKAKAVDVANAAVSCSAEADVNYSADGKEILEITPYAGVRKIIGDKLSESKFTSPHLYFTQKVNLERLLEVRKQVNEAQARKTSVTDYIAKAAALALQKYPQMNSSLAGDQIIAYKTVNLGIAVASPSGLIVPNVKGAEQMSVVEISKVSGGLFEKARSGKLLPEEYGGGTFTISNLGMFGIENFTAIINPPEVGILAVSSMKDEPYVETKADGQKEIAIKPMMNIQLSVDHRVIDGLLAAQFVTEIKNMLENPIRLLI